MCAGPTLVLTERRLSPWPQSDPRQNSLCRASIAIAPPNRMSHCQAALLSGYMTQLPARNRYSCRRAAGPAILMQRHRAATRAAIHEMHYRRNSLFLKPTRGSIPSLRSSPSVEHLGTYNWVPGAESSSASSKHIQFNTPKTTHIVGAIYCASRGTLNVAHFRWPSAAARADKSQTEPIAVHAWRSIGNSPLHREGVFTGQTAYKLSTGI